MDTRTYNAETGNQPEAEPGRYEIVGASVLRLAESLRHSFGDAEASQFLEAERLAQLGITDANLELTSRTSAASLAYLPPNTVQAPPAPNIDYGVAAQEA